MCFLSFQRKYNLFQPHPTYHCIKSEQIQLKLSLHLLAFLLVVLMSQRILREPSAENSLFLEKHLMDAPETAEGETSDNYREDFVFNVEGNCTENYTGRQPYPPTMPNFSGCKVRQYNPDILEREWKDLGLSLHLLAEGRWRHSRFFLEKPGKIGLIF